MLIYSMNVTLDGYITDREGAFGWGVASDEQFAFHLAQVRELGGYLLGRRLYEAMLVWETDPAMRVDELRAAFADAWSAIPKVVFSRTLDSVQGNARLAEASVAEEALRRSTRPLKTSRSAAPLWPRRRSSSASSASCTCSAIRSWSVAARRSCRRSPNRFHWT